MENSVPTCRASVIWRLAFGSTVRPVHWWRRAPTITRCPSELIGRNSAIPCTTPRMTASAYSQPGMVELKLRLERHDRIGAARDEGNRLQVSALVLTRAQSEIPNPIGCKSVPIHPFFHP